MFPDDELCARYLLTTPIVMSPFKCDQANDTGKEMLDWQCQLY